MKCINDFIYELLIISSNERKYKCYDTFVIFFHNPNFFKISIVVRKPTLGKRERERVDCNLICVSGMQESINFI